MSREIKKPSLKELPWRKSNKEYWTDTFSYFNPFSGGYYCPECKELPEEQRTWDDPELPGGVGSWTEFQCANKHRWLLHRIHD